MSICFTRTLSKKCFSCYVYVCVNGGGGCSRLPTTSRKPVLLDIGSVLTWHMYHPRSFSRVSLMWRDHVRWPLWVTAIRWFFVITWLAIVRIVCVSTRSHATCKSEGDLKKKKKQQQIRQTATTIGRNARQKLLSFKRSWKKVQMRFSIISRVSWYNFQYFTKLSPFLEEQVLWSILASS